MRGESLKAKSRNASHGIWRDDDGAAPRLVASGAWTIANAASLDHQLTTQISGFANGQVRHGTLDLSLLEKLDTAGAWLLHKAATQVKATGGALAFTGVASAHQGLLNEIASASAQPEAPASKLSWLSSALQRWPAALSGIAREASDLVAFFGVFLMAVGRLLAGRGTLRTTALIHHLDHAGVRAAPIIALICFLIGAVVMQQGALQLATYGAEPYAASMLGVLALREIGVLLTAVMVAGRSASAFTAEIGSMKMREEIDAMRTLGIDPVETLVIPRILALLIALPLLTFVGDIMCLAGGAAVAVFYLDQSIATFLERLQAAAEPRHFIAGMIKTPFAALVIGLVGCSEGLKVAGSAESLGRCVTTAVVKAIFLVIILGAVFAMFLVSIGV